MPYTDGATYRLASAQNHGQRPEARQNDRIRIALRVASTEDSQFLQTNTAWSAPAWLTGAGNYRPTDNPT